MTNSDHSLSTLVMRNEFRGSPMTVSFQDVRILKILIQIARQHQYAEFRKMCGRSPACKSFLDTRQAAGSFIHVSGISMLRIFVAGHYGVRGFGSGPVPRTRWYVSATWFSRCRPYDRLLHKTSGNSPPSASGEMPSANFVPSSASGVDDQLLPVFIPPSDRDARASVAGNFVSEHMGAQAARSTPSGLPRFLLETSPDFRDRPLREGSNHSISPLKAFPNWSQ